MNTITAKELKALSHLPGKPCVSLYMPTTPGGAEKDPLQFKNLLTLAEEQLRERGLGRTETLRLLEPAGALHEDRAFWRKTLAGLAVFLNPGAIRIYHLRNAPPVSATVGDTFLLKPLVGMLEEEDAFYVLALSPKRIRLWEGNAAELKEVELTRMPTNLADALRFHDRDEPLDYHTQKVGGHWAAIFHGQGVGIDTFKDDLLLYFQKIDHGLREYLPAKAPLILASVEYLWPIYRKANHYPHLLGKGIAGNPEAWSAAELHRRAWEIVQQGHPLATAVARDRFAALAGTGRTCHELDETLQAACAGKLETLLVALDKEAWGECNKATREVKLHEARTRTSEDLLNVAAIEALDRGVDVYAIPSGEMPGGKSIAGIYWLPNAKHV